MRGSVLKIVIVVALLSQTAMGQSNKVQECITRCDDVLAALTEVTERQADEVTALEASLAHEVAERERNNVWYRDAFLTFVVGLGLGLLND